VTQCITHFRHRGAAAGMALGRGARALAAALPQPPAGGAPESPAVWTLELGRGRVLVTLLDPGSGPSRGPAAAILARGVEWASRREVTVRLEGALDLALECAPAPGFFLGREIAPVMSYRGADWLLRPDREETERPEAVLDDLRIRPGAAVVDFGAGVGYFTLRLARRVGPEGRVLAVEVQEEMLAGLRRRAAAEGAANIECILATEDDPRLSPASADLVLMVDVYHELARPQPVMEAVRRSLRPGGRLALVEYRGEDPAVPIKPLHRTTLRQMEAELHVLGFRVVEVKESLPHQRLITAAVAAAGGE
jgi:ubiquinone/menaquinone biosynthesis C-methylase UbiE